ncbi:ribonuclease domain-containing protein [Streptococcus ruminantium]|uniref:ribonuclease domain-containing protein n=1 Tax=Streptococcus ruminantium TaxID=1917441 RepID=UPI0013EF0E90|nr:ribonuclease domain-containing protein [Streptococcus ruminantium]
MDTVVDAAQGGNISPASIGTNLAINAITEGVSSKTVKGQKGDIAPDFKAIDVDNLSVRQYSKSVPDYVDNVLKEIRNNKGNPPEGYKGGKIYNNTPKGGEQKLPAGINYKEYDVHPKIKGVTRGTERVVIGDDGSVWYTDDHYETFMRVE